IMNRGKLFHCYFGLLPLIVVVCSVFSIIFWCAYGRYAASSSFFMWFLVLAGGNCVFSFGFSFSFLLYLILDFSFNQELKVFNIAKNEEGKDIKGFIYREATKEYVWARLDSEYDNLYFLRKVWRHGWPAITGVVLMPMPLLSVFIFSFFTTFGCPESHCHDDP